MSKSGNGWYQVPVGPSVPMKHGLFIEGCLRALVWQEKPVEGTPSIVRWELPASPGDDTTYGMAASLEDAKAEAEEALTKGG